jgi:hypothetical protein
MSLYRVGKVKLEPVAPTNFAEEGLVKRMIDCLVRLEGALRQPIENLDF